MRCGYKRFGKLLDSPLHDRSIVDRAIVKTINDASAGRGLMGKLAMESEKQIVSVLIREFLNMFIESYVELVTRNAQFPKRKITKIINPQTAILFRPHLPTCFNQCGSKQISLLYFITEWLSWIRLMF